MWYRCPICGVQYNEQGWLKRHLKKKHSKSQDEVDFECSDQKREYQREKDFMNPDKD